MRNLDLIVVRTEALRDDVRLRDHGLQPRSGGAGEQEARTMRATEIVRQELFKPER